MSLQKNVHYILSLFVLLLGSISGTSVGICSEDASAVASQTLTLEEAIEYALVHNRSLQSTELGLSSSEMSLRSQEAEFDLKIVPTARVGYSSADPGSWQAGATLSKQLTIGANISVAPIVGESDGQTSTDVAFALNLPLLRGAGKEFAMNAVYSSLYAYESAHLSFYSQQEDTVLQTVTSVYATIRSGLQTELLEKQLGKLKEHLALAGIKEKSGIISAIDLYRAEIRIKNVQDELTSIREQHANNIDEVKDILAIPQSGEIILTAPVDYQLVEIELEDALQIAQDNRIEIEQLKRKLTESKRQVAIAENKLLPQLDLELGYNLSGDDAIFELPDESWTVTLSSNTDVFRTVEKNAYQQRKIQFRQVQLDMVSRKERINQQVRSELNSLEKQEERIEIRKEQVSQTIGKLRLAESKFRYGMADNFDLIEAQTELQEAQTNHLFERISYIIGTYRLRSVLGTLLERRVGQ